MREPEPVPRPPLWMAGVLALIVIGVLISTGWRRGAGPILGEADTSLAPPVTSSTFATTTSRVPAQPDTTAAAFVSVPSFVALDPTEAITGTLAVVVSGADDHLLLHTFGVEARVHDLPRNTGGPVLFDLSREQYAFIDSGFRLHIRSVRAARDQADLSEAIGLDVRSFAWSRDEAHRIAWVTFERGRPVLFEGAPKIRVVGYPGDVDLVGFDATGFYVMGGGLGTPGAAVLTKLDLGGAPVTSIPADLVHVGSGGLVVVGRIQPATVEGPYVFDWFLTDPNLSSLEPFSGPPSAVAIDANHLEPRAVAFLTYDGFRGFVDVFVIEGGPTQRFDLGEVRAWDLKWSDDDRFIVVSGTEAGGRGHLVLVLGTEAGAIVPLAFDDWVQSAGLVTLETPANGIVVPDVRGLELTEAAAVMDAAGLIGRVVDLDSTDGTSVVRAQLPGAGVRVPLGSTIGLRTLTVTRLGCESSVLGPSIAELPGTYGGITMAGLSEGTPVVHGNLSPDAAGRRLAVEVVAQLDAGLEPMWVVLPGELPGEGAGLLYDRTVFNSVGRYLLSETAQAVELPRCSGTSHTQYVGGLVVGGPRCVDIWIYEGSLRNDPTTIRVGIDTSC